jgi:TonB family protein
MSNPWKLWEGQVVDGKLPLFRYLGGSEHCAVFLTERHERGHSEGAAIKLLPASAEVADLQLARWKRAAKLSHPNLVPLYEMGCCELRGVPLVYVVMESAEENLAQILPSRALAPAEATAMLQSVLGVLGYLHSEGFVHGRVHPGNIMASGDQLKISSDSLRRAGESLAGARSDGPYDPPEYARGGAPTVQTVSPTGDIWSLGMTLVETLTQKLPEAPSADRPEQVILPPLQEPFLDIARHCLLRNPDARWKPAQIGVRLQGRIPMPEIPDERAEVPRAEVQPPPPERPPAQPAVRPSAVAAKRSNYTLPIAVGVAALLAVILLGARLLRHREEAPQAPAVAEEQPSPPPPLKQAAPKAKAHASKPANSSKLMENEQTLKPPAAVPAMLHPETAPAEPTNAVASYPAGSPAHGEVLHQAPPEVLQSAINSIHGTVRVSVKVNVDRSGNIEDAELESRGPSKYFARVALEAAQGWKFKPPMIGGRGVLSTWTLRYEFTRDGAAVVPTQDAP